jgi:crotonobetainyl-CoA:carnitine CoA-transferase CaiB-like acyl-CoA transferase
MLNELLVIDASTVLAGPSAGTFFAEAGARVIKIEHPRHPDVTRSWKLPTEATDSSVSAYFSSINYGKEYRQLDLQDATDHAAFMELIQAADILLTNFKKGDDLKLQITDEALHARNPRLIIGKIHGYGSESDRVAYDLILQAESGFMSMNGTPESGPVKMPVALIDVLAAHHLKEGVLLALYERTRSGRGKSVSVSLYDAALCSLVNQASNYLMGGQVPQRIGSLHPNIAPYGELFHTADDALITLAIGSDAHFEKLCAVLELTALSTDPRFLHNQDRVQHRAALAEVLSTSIGQRQSDELLQKLEALHVPAGKIRDLQEVFQDAAAQQLVRRERIDNQDTARITSIAFK